MVGAVEFGTYHDALHRESMARLRARRSVYIHSSSTVPHSPQRVVCVFKQPVCPEPTRVSDGIVLTGGGGNWVRRPVWSTPCPFARGHVKVQ